MKMIKRKKLHIKNCRGSAIIMALIVMTVLVLMGLAVATLSMGTLKSNTTDATNNDAYYAAEAGINSAIEQVKYEAFAYYNAMLDAETGEYGALYDNFFNGINYNTQAHFVEPKLTNVTTQTTFTTGSYDDVTKICEFLITCRATATNGLTYDVHGSVLVKKVDVANSQSVVFKVDNAAIKAGGTLALEKKNGVTANDGNIIVAELTHSHKWGLPYIINGGNFFLNPNVGQTIYDVLTYDSFSDPVLEDIDLIVTQSDTTLTWAHVPKEPVCITSNPEIDIHIANCTMPNGVIYSKGDMHVNNCTMYADLYVDGNIHVNNCSVYGNIYIRGNFDGNNAQIHGRIYSDGYIYYNNGALYGSAYAGNGIDIHNASSSGSLFSPKLVKIMQTGVTSAVVYSSEKIEIGNCSINAIVFSGADIELTHSLSVSGCVIAKNDIYFTTDSNKHMTVNYSPSTIEDILSDTDNDFFTTQTGPGEPELNEDVFISQTITPVGRSN